MPTYDYECLQCGEIIEIFQNINDLDLSVCPHCRGRVKKIIGCGSGLIFKGKGFYVTDYKNTSTTDKNMKKSFDTTKNKK